MTPYRDTPTRSAPGSARYLTQEWWWLNSNTGQKREMRLAGMAATTSQRWSEFRLANRLDAAPLVRTRFRPSSPRWLAVRCKIADRPAVACPGV